MLKPFASIIWYSLILTILLASVVMAIIFRWQGRHHPTAAMSSQGDSAIVTVFAVYCQQGYSRMPTLFSGRCLFIFLFLSSIMVYNYYTSVLVSTLVESSSQTNIRNVYDLADSNLKIGFDASLGSYIKGFLTVCIAYQPYSQFFYVFQSTLSARRRPQSPNISILSTKSWIAAAKLMLHRPYSTPAMVLI